MEELFQYNIFPEYHALKTRLFELKEDDKTDRYSRARFNIIKFVIHTVKNDPIQGDFYDDECNKLLKQAGNLLYQSEGMKGMHDLLVWSFIPKRHRRTVENAWSGIGNWQS